MAFSVGAIAGTVTLDNTKWNAAIIKVKKDQKSLANLTIKNAKKIEKLGKSMSIAGGAIVAGFGLAVKSAINFNKQMAKIATLIPKNRDRVLELKEGMQELGVEVGKSTDDLAEGAYEIVSAFGDSSESMQKLKLNALAATAGMSTTIDAIRLTSAVTKGYGDTTAEAMRKASDLAFMTVKLGQTTFPELAASIGKTVPVAKKMNVAQEELYAGFATLTGVTGNAAEVSTQLAGIMRAFIKPSTDMTAAIDKLGYSTAEEMIKANGLVGSLRKLIKNTDGSTAAVGKLVRRAEGLTAMFALTGAQSDTFDNKLSKMKDSAGATDEAFKEVSEGVNKTGFEFEQAKVKMSVLVQKMGEQLIPIASRVIETISGIVTRVTDWMKENPKLSATISKVVVVAGGLMVALGPILMILPKIAAGINIMKAALIATNPYILAAAAAATAASFAFKAWGNAHDKVTKKLLSNTTKEQEAIKKLHEFRKTATEKDKKLIVDLLKRFGDAEVSYGTIASKVNDILKIRSKKYREFASDFEKTEKTVTKINKDETESRIRLSDRELESRKKALEERLQAEREVTEEVGEIVEESIEKERELAFNYMEFMRTQAQQRKMLGLQGLNEELMRLQIETENKEAALKKEFEGHVLLEEMLTELWKNHDLKKRKMTDDFNKLQQQQSKITWEKMAGFAVTATNLISNISNQAYQNRMGQLDKEYADRKKYIMENIVDETEREKALELLEDEFTQKKIEAARSAAIADKAAAMMGAIVNTAQAVTKAYAQGGIFGIATAGIMAALGAIQVALIARQPVPMAEGGIVTQPTQILAGEAGPETIIPLDRLSEVSNMNNENDEGTVRQIHITIQAMDSVDVERFTNERLIPILQRATDTENFIINPNAVR